jgi:hypothetical protein
MNPINSIPLPNLTNLSPDQFLRVACVTWDLYYPSELKQLNNGKDGRLATDTFLVILNRQPSDSSVGM